MKKRSLAFLSIFALLLSLLGSLSLPAAAEDAPPLARDFWSTDATTLYVEEQEDLEAIAEIVESGNNLSGYTFYQQGNIALEGEFSPIGTKATPFAGSYNGNGYKISGLSIDTDADYQGLFGASSGDLRNIVLGADCSIKGGRYVGGIVGLNSGKVRNCISDASVSSVFAPLGSASIKVMTQNLCIWGDDDLSATTSRRPGMMKRISTNDADIILFQELSNAERIMDKGTEAERTIPSWETYLNSNLQGYTLYYVPRSVEPDEGVAIAYKPNKFEEIEKGCFWLSETPDAPVSDQEISWGAGCRRNCTWAVLKEKNSNQKIALFSIHLDYANDTARTKEALVALEKIEAISQKYPEAMVLVGGDFNARTNETSFKTFSAALADSRLIATDRLNSFGTVCNLTNNSFSNDVIDYIMVDDSTTAVAEFYVSADMYDGMFPSDHHAVVATVEPIDACVGGIVGKNTANGSAIRLIARGQVLGGSAPGIVIGDNSGSASAIYYAGSGSAIGRGSSSTTALLPNAVSLAVPYQLNVYGNYKAFTVYEGDYAPIGERELPAPTRITLNGEEKYALSGSLFEMDCSSYLRDGEFINGSSFIVPTGDITIDFPKSVQSVTSMQTSGHFTVANATEWMYLSQKYFFFNKTDITIHLIGDIDLGETVAANFTGFIGTEFSLNGHGHTIKNWGTEAAPITTHGLFYAKMTSTSSFSGQGGMNSLKNFRLSNCHITAAGQGSALVYGFYCGNYGISDIPATLTLEGIHIDQCKIHNTSSPEVAFLLGRYLSYSADTTVNISKCSITKSYFYVNNQLHTGALVGRIFSAFRPLTFNISDIYIADTTVTKTATRTGFIFGTVDSNRSTAYLNRIGIFHSTMDAGSDRASLIGANHGGAVNIRASIFADNTMVSAIASYLIGNKPEAAGNASNTSINHTNLCSDPTLAVEYTDDTANGCVYGVGGKWISTLASADFKNGGAAWRSNHYIATDSTISNRAGNWYVGTGFNAYPTPLYAEGLGMPKKVAVTAMRDGETAYSGGLYTNSEGLLNSADLEKGYIWYMGLKKIPVDQVFTADAEAVNFGLSDKPIGDCNGNGKSTIADVVLILRLLNGEEEIPLYHDLFNFDQNNQIDTADAISMLRQIIG